MCAVEKGAGVFSGHLCFFPSLGLCSIKHKSLLLSEPGGYVSLLSLSCMHCFNHFISQYENC